MPRIQTNQMISLGAVLTPTKQVISVDLSIVPFVPDEMIVRQVSYVPDLATTISVAGVKCDFLQSPVAIVAIGDTNLTIGVNVFPNNAFKLNHANISGVHNFSIFDATNISSPFVLNGDIAILLEFVKYK